MLKMMRSKLGELRAIARVLVARRRVGVHHWLVENPYHQMIYSRFEGDMRPAKLTHSVELAAFSRLPAKGRVLWIHSEASYSWTEEGVDLDQSFARYHRALTRWVEKGGMLAWTVHDTGLHLSDDDPKRIAQLRQILCDNAVLVHVHSEAAKAQIAEQFGLDPARIDVVPHPSYAAHYAHDAQRSVEDVANPRSLLFFGYLKPYKNFEGLAQALISMGSGSFAKLTVAGRKSTDVDLHSEQLAQAMTLDARLRYIDDAEVPDLFAGAHFLTLPYTESLTSGAAALAMGFGVPVIAADLGGMRESVPVENHKLLYSTQDAGGLAQALQAARDMSVEDYTQLRAACQAFGDAIHPHRVSEKLLNLLTARMASQPT